MIFFRAKNNKHLLFLTVLQVGSLSCAQLAGPLVSSGLTHASTVSCWVSQRLAGLGWPQLGSPIFAPPESLIIPQASSGLLTWQVGSVQIYTASRALGLDKHDITCLCSVGQSKSCGQRGREWCGSSFCRWRKKPGGCLLGRLHPAQVGRLPGKALL